MQTKIWHLPEDGIVESISNPVSVVVQNGKRMENIAWNPIADNVLAVSSQQAINVYDVVGQSECVGEFFFSSVEYFQQFLLQYSWSVSCLPV